jgi:hypothetical protein
MNGTQKPVPTGQIVAALAGTVGLMFVVSAIYLCYTRCCQKKRAMLGEAEDRYERLAPALSMHDMSHLRADNGEA